VNPDDLPSPDLAACLTAAATALPGVDERRADDAALEWRRGGTVFAALDAPDEASFLLDAAVAAAALRTPDTRASPRGRDWVAFGPSVLDRFAIDRATAWLEAAWRRAER